MLFIRVYARKGWELTLGGLQPMFPHPDLMIFLGKTFYILSGAVKTSTSFNLLVQMLFEETFQWQNKKKGGGRREIFTNPPSFDYMIPQLFRVSWWQMGKCENFYL